MVRITVYANDTNEVLASRLVKASRAESTLSQLGNSSFGRPFYLVQEPARSRYSD